MYLHVFRYSIHIDQIFECSRPGSSLSEQISQFGTGHKPKNCYSCSDWRRWNCCSPGRCRKMSTLLTRKMSGCESDEKIKATPPIKNVSCHEIPAILELQFSDVAKTPVLLLLACLFVCLFVGDVVVQPCRRMSCVTLTAQRTLAKVNDINIKGVEDILEPKQIGWSKTERSSFLRRGAVKICLIIMNADECSRYIDICLTYHNHIKLIWGDNTFFDTFV